MEIVLTIVCVFLALGCVRWVWENIRNGVYPRHQYVRSQKRARYWRD